MKLQVVQSGLNKFSIGYFLSTISFKNINLQRQTNKAVWPSGLRRRFKAPVSSGAWVRIPPLSYILISNGSSSLISLLYTLSQNNFLE